MLSGENERCGVPDKRAKWLFSIGVSGDSGVVYRRFNVRTGRSRLGGGIVGRYEDARNEYRQLCISFGMAVADILKINQRNIYKRHDERRSDKKTLSFGVISNMLVISLLVSD